MPRSRASLLDCGMCEHLFRDAPLIMPDGIPALMPNVNRAKPRDIIPLEKARSAAACGDVRCHVCGFVSDRAMITVFTKTDEWIPVFRNFDGVIVPDLSVIDGMPTCVNKARVALCRALGLYLQRRGIPVVPTVRWGEPSTLEYCFTGIPRGVPVALGTLTCLDSERGRKNLSEGLPVMLDVLEPPAVYVYGRMPDAIFGPFRAVTRLHHYPSRIDRVHGKDGD